MKCPNCGKEMVAGQVESAREINWIQNGEKPVRISSRLFFSSKADGDIKYQKIHFVKGS